MGAYISNFSKWAAGLTHLELAVLKQLAVKQDSVEGRYRNHPGKERQLSRLEGLISSRNLTPEQWKQSLSLIVNLPEDDLCYFIDSVIGDNYSQEEMATLINYASKDVQNRILDSVSHFEKVSLIGKIYSKENLSRVTVAAIKQKNKK